MNTERIKAARQRLASEYKLLTESIRRGRLAANEIQIENTEDEGDLATISQTRDLVYNLQDSDFERLKCVEKALESLANGHYGECARCGEDIKENRLAVVPWATMCIHCQESAEVEASAQHAVGNHDRPGMEW
jgi:DnaK suppressor protein